MSGCTPYAENSSSNVVAEDLQFRGVEASNRAGQRLVAQHGSRASEALINRIQG